MANPLSIWKYYRYNRRKVNVVFIITFLSIILQYALLVYVAFEINFTAEIQALGLIKSVSLVKLINPTREKQNSFIKLLKQQSMMNKVTPYMDSGISMSQGDSLLIFLKHPQIAPLMRTLNQTLIRGRLPNPDSHEVILHWRIAANKGLKIGDWFTEKNYEDSLSKYQLTGLLDGKRIMGFADLEQYIREYQRPEETLTLLIAPQSGHRVQVNQYLERQAQKKTLVFTSKVFERDVLGLRNDFILMASAIHLTITGIIAICAGFLFYLYFYQRQSEFGLLEALGHTRSFIVGRSFLEILVLNLLGLGSALGVSFIGGWTLNHLYLHARGLDLTLWEPGYLFKLLSTPLIVTFCSLTPVWRLLKRVDPILIIERVGSCTAIKRVKPLSNWHFFHNNYRRVGAVFMVAFLSAVLQSGLLLYTTSILRLEQRSEIAPWSKVAYAGYLKLAPVKLRHLRQSLGIHPAIAKVLPYGSSTTKMYGVGITTFPILYLDANEIQSLMAVLNLKLVQGRLPKPQSCEIITHQQLAANWGIKPGSRLPRSKFRLVGCFDGKPLLGLGNLDRYLSTQHLRKDQLNLLLIPKRGQIGQVKHYLSQLRQTDPELFTSIHEEQSCHEDINELDLVFNLVYVTITGIICLCVCFLYYLYFWQRRPELGMLEAIGHTPQKLVGRALTEILGINLFAFALGVITAYLGGWALNHLVLTRHGLPLVLWDPGYPGKLLPLPFLVTGISLIPVWRMLTQVDPIAMIEGET